ncbi:MAG: hypothetical protein FGM41_10995 [Bacteroidetes bacterium]|jgi:hypothetical protein|nr:hypothetical protein [Bacteroidota bacterium]
MTLIVAASVGMGAIKCHNKMETFFEVQKQPKRWANSNAFVMLVGLNGNAFNFLSSQKLIWNR